MLGRCTGWYVPLLSACNKIGVSGNKAHLEFNGLGIYQNDDEFALLTTL